MKQMNLARKTRTTCSATNGDEIDEKKVKTTVLFFEFLNNFATLQYISKSLKDG
jgi:hypothetical protein